MRRLLILPLLALLTVLGPTPASADPQPQAVRHLKVLTYNIHHGEGPDHRVDLDRIAAEINESGADVIGLQEVDRHWSERSGFADQPTELAARTGMFVAYAPNLDLDPLTPGAPRRQYGTAVLSRFPITTFHNTLLPKQDPSEEQRGLSEAVLDVHGVAVRIMNTHLHHASAASRQLQSEVIAEAVRSSAEPVALTGDLNATPDAPEITMLTDVLRDSHTDAGTGDGATYPVEAPTNRIDYVLASRSRFLHSQVLGSASSDHRPVLADLLVNGKP